jgi:hypothetical protein
MLVEDRSRNKCFFQVRISHVSRFISICDIFTDSESSTRVWVMRNAYKILVGHPGGKDLTADARLAFN